MKLKTALLTILFLMITSVSVFSQDVDIIPHLKKIESGEKEEVLKDFPRLKEKNPLSPSVRFLEGVLTENGEQSISIYEEILEKYPESKYADACAFRIYSYYYAIGSYDKSKAYLTRLKSQYPESPYIKIADRKPVVTDDSPPEKKTGIEIVKKDDRKEQGSTQGQFYTIQAGAFSNEENAVNLKQDFIGSGFTSEISEKLVGGTLFRVVYVGRFSSEEEARNILQLINREYKLDGRVVPVKE